MPGPTAPEKATSLTSTPGIPGTAGPASRAAARRNGRRLGWLVLLLVLVPLAWTGVRAWQAKGSLEQARGQLESARAALLGRDLPAARAHLTRAAADTRRARSLTHDPVTAALAHVPLLGRSLTVVRGVAEGADDLSRNVLPPALHAAQSLDPTRLRRPDGSIDLAVLAAAEPGIAQAADRAADVSARAGALPRSWLPGVVGRRRTEFVDQAAALTKALRSATDALRIAPALLGQDRPRRWFVLVQQTSESRGTGGLPGGFAVLETSKGHLQVQRQGSNAELPDGRVDPRGLPPDFTSRYEMQGSFDIWQNINLSPDLPVVSRYLAQRWKAQGGQAVDGVIAVDAVALADLLQGSGPVQVAPGQQIAPDKIEDYLALGQYAGSGVDKRVRKEKLTNVARAVVTRLTGGGGDSTALLKGLIAAVRSGHVHIASDDSALAPVLQRTGADGGLPRDDAPFAYPVVFNASGGKLEYFLDRTVTYTGGSCDGKRRRTSVSVTLRADPPPLTALPTYVSIRLTDGKVTQSLVDRLALSVFATRGARLLGATLDGKALGTSPSNDPYVDAGTEAGLPVWQTYLDLPPGHDRVLVLTLDEPVVTGTPQLLEQPLARPEKGTVSVPAC